MRCVLDKLEQWPTGWSNCEWLLARPAVWLAIKLNELETCTKIRVTNYPATMAKLQKANNTTHKNNNGNRNRNRNKKNINVNPNRVLRLMSCLLFIKKTNEFFDLSERKAEHNLKIERRQLTICCFSASLSGFPDTCLCLPWHWKGCRSRGRSWWVWCQLLNIYLNCCSSAYCLFRAFLLIKWQPPSSLVYALFA